MPEQTQPEKTREHKNWEAMSRLVLMYTFGAGLLVQVVFYFLPEIEATRIQSNLVAIMISAVVWKMLSRKKTNWEVIMGILATAAIYFAGFTLVLRPWLAEVNGYAALIPIIATAILTYLEYEELLDEKIFGKSQSDASADS